MLSECFKPKVTPLKFCQLPHWRVWVYKQMKAIGLFPITKFVWVEIEVGSMRGDRGGLGRAGKLGL